MLFKEKTKDLEAYLEQWPASFYELTEAAKRRQLLDLHCRKDGKDAQDAERKTLLEQRYAPDGSDRYMYAWMMLKIKENERPGFLLKKKKTKEVRDCLETLGVYGCNDLQKEEWRHFARTLVLANAGSKAYRTAIFGMVNVNDRQTARRIAREIYVGAKQIPAQYGMEEDASVLYEILRETYVSLIHQGEDILKEMEG